MLEKIITYFTHRHLLANLIFIGVFIAGIFAWQYTSKEHMPDVTFDRIRITVRYPGATAEEVEYFVTRPIEDAIRGLDGIYRVTSTSSMNSCSVMVELQPKHPDKTEILNEMRNNVLEVKLPEDIIDQPSFRQFKTANRAILDIGLYNEQHNLLDYNARHELQTIALALENQLLNLSEVNSVSRSGYNQEEIHIKAIPEKLVKYNIPFNTVMREIKNSNIRQPAGSIDSKDAAKVTLMGELDTIEKLENLAIQGGFESQLIKLKNVAQVVKTFEENQTITKINGREGIFLNVVKSSQYGILEALEAIERVAERFSHSLEDGNIKLITLDDESVDLRNRLSLVKINGIIGFTLILTMLFLFLDFKSGIWVALGIPFTFCFALVSANLLGYTINNMTLAAVIIVMGMVVDDAIVVAENITRTRSRRDAPESAVVQATSYVFLPIVASITTTCVAFAPMYFFSGRFARMVAFIPPIIIIMLGASLFESLFILPGHMSLKFEGLRHASAALLKLFGKKQTGSKESNQTDSIKSHWFEAIENIYGTILEKLLPFKSAIFILFILLLLFSGYIMKSKMKFVMFPNEETRDIRFDAEAPIETTRLETEKLSRQLDTALLPYVGKEIIGYRTRIAQSRWGGAAEEHKLTTGIEIVPKEKRTKSANTLIREWEAALKHARGFITTRFSKSRWGQSSGSAIEIIVQENTDDLRDEIAERIALKLKEHPALHNVEIARPLRLPEHKVRLTRDTVKRLGITPSNVGATFRAILEGTILYELVKGDEEIPVRFTAVDEVKKSMENVLTVPVENQKEYLVPLGNIVEVDNVTTPISIERLNYKRTVTVYADLKEKTGVTPLDIAAYVEKNIFPDINTRYPTAVVSFGGEVQDTRESQRDLFFGVIMALTLIYLIIALLFNSMFKPLIIMFSIPFGMVGIILAFWLHGMTLFGFFAAIGALGLAGVVVNDSIIMLVKLDTEYDHCSGKELNNRQIARTAQTRLKAVMLTTLTTVAGLLPTAYGFAGYDAMLAEMMLAMAWGLMFGTLITLFLVPCLYSAGRDIKDFMLGRARC